MMWRLLRVSTTGILQIELATASWVALTRILSEFGSVALAGNTFAIRSIMIVQLPAWGMSNAAATLVGQNLGAKKPERAERAVWTTGLYNMTYLCVAGLIACLRGGHRPVLLGPPGDPSAPLSDVHLVRLAVLLWAMVFLRRSMARGHGDSPWINFSATGYSGIRKLLAIGVGLVTRVTGDLTATLMDAHICTVPAKRWKRRI
jgi:Na+-driven multidrug efflux pump